MKLGVLTVPLYSMSLKDALKYIKGLGAEMCELGCGGNPGKVHCDPDILLDDEKQLQIFKDTLKEAEIEISSLSCHCNPVHPNEHEAEQADSDLKKAVLLAEKLGIRNINTFSGCPGDSNTSKYPNWVTCAWPDDFMTVLDYQWNDVLIPYWKNFVKFASEHGVDKIAFEPHPGFCVYNPKTLLKIREAVGPQIGANLDPSHLFWQGIDPVAAIKELNGAIFHFHAKDTRIDPYTSAVNGVLDLENHVNVAERSWVFRTVGYGHGTSVWNDIISALRTTGYDYAISIEHEDSLMSCGEGLKKACDFLNGIIIKEPKNQNFHL